MDLNFDLGLWKSGVSVLNKNINVTDGCRPFYNGNKLNGRIIDEVFCYSPDEKGNKKVTFLELMNYNRVIHGGDGKEGKLLWKTENYREEIEV